MKNNNHKENKKKAKVKDSNEKSLFSLIISYIGKIGLFTVFLFIFGFLIAPHAFNVDLEISRYNIKTSKKLPQNLKIILITDLHNGYYGEKQKELVKTIYKENPDLIFLVGNIVDEKIPVAGTIDLLENIYKKYKIYYVTGNSEYKSKRIKEIKDTMLAYGVKILEGTTDKFTIDNSKDYIYISGIDDPTNPHTKSLLQLKRAYAEIENYDKFKILLAYRPEKIEEYLERDYDLIVSGHGNGGYWRIPYIFPNGLFAHDQGFFPKYTSRLYTHKKKDHLTNHIVSRGLSKKTLAPRIFNRPELVIINISSDKK